MEKFNKLCVQMDGAVKTMYTVTFDESKKYSGIYKRDMSKLGRAFNELSLAFKCDDTQG